MTGMGAALNPHALVATSVTGLTTPQTRDIAAEVPVSIIVNGIGHAVMMASPQDLTDFAYGFALTDGLVHQPSDILSVEEHGTAPGILLKLELAPHRFAPFAERVRSATGTSGCGICGITNLEQALRSLPPLEVKSATTSAAIFRALGALPRHQLLNAATGAVHAAAFCSTDGDILAVREDIGRHNAFDKLIGHLLRSRVEPSSGFVLLTSRCSYELVEKAVMAGIPALVTISAPTTLAIERARSCDLLLVCLARPDSLLVVHDPHRMIANQPEQT